MKPTKLRNHEYLAPGARYGFFVHDLNELLLPHWHDFFELELVIRGDGTHIMNGMHLPLHPGSVFLLTPADFHEIRPDPSEIPLRLLNLIFTEAFVRDSIYELVFSCRYQEAMSFQWSDSAYDAIKREFEVISEETRQPAPGSDQLVQGAMERILISLFRMQSDGCNGRDDGTVGIPGNIRRSLAYIHHHFRRPLTLASVAERAGLSPNYFSEVFHHHTGQSFQEYLQSLRISFSARMLRGTDVSVTDVCYTSGFNSLSHFERVFRHHFGSSPREYRR